jgi:hypothetical protein
MKKVFRLVWNGLKSFGLFWKNFLIGDSPEIAVGVLIILGIAFGVRGSPIAAAVIVPLAVFVLLTGSIWRGKTKSKP